MIINNARTLMPDGVFETLSISVRDGLITQISKTPFENGFDATGLTLAPGFIDVHIHGFGGVDVMEGEQAVRSISEALPRHGVTTFLPTTMSAPDYETYRALKAIKTLIADTPGARIPGAHVEGRLINTVRAGAQDKSVAAAPTNAIFNAMTGDCTDAVRLMTLAPELPGAEPFIKMLTARGIRVSCGHSDASYEAFIEACSWGITQVTHMFNGMNPLHHREPGVPGGALASDAFVQVIADGIHLHPAILKLIHRIKGLHKAMLITDAMMATGLGDGTYSLGGQRVFVQNGAARVKSGALAGSTLTMDTAIRNMVNMAGVPVEDALIMATATPAAAMGFSDRGVIEAGRLADLVLLDGDLNVVSAMVGGRCVYGREMG